MTQTESEEALARVLSRLALLRHRGPHKTIERNVDALWPQYVGDAREVLRTLAQTSPSQGPAV